MKCPHCENELEVEDRVWLNCDWYGKPATALTLCCGKMVNVSPSRTYYVNKSDAKEDSWGNTLLLRRGNLSPATRARRV